MAVRLVVTSNTGGGAIIAKIVDDVALTEILLTEPVANFSTSYDSSISAFRASFSLPASINGTATMVQNADLGGLSEAQEVRVASNPDGTGVIMTLVGQDDSQTDIPVTIPNLSGWMSESALGMAFQFPGTVDPDTGSIL